MGYVKNLSFTIAGLKELQDHSPLSDTDCHFRVGGALGTDLQIAQCPKITGGLKSQCIGGSVLMVMTPDANG